MRDGEIADGGDVLDVERIPVSFRGIRLVDESCDAGAAVPAAKQPRLLVHPPAPSELPEPVADPAPFVAPEPAEVLPGDYRGPFAAGSVWLQLRGTGSVLVDGAGAPLAIDGDGTYLVLDPGLHTAGTLALSLTGDLVCEAIQLEPGVSATG